jgi:tetratricopeptide (TPR) repeat protein
MLLAASELLESRDFTGDEALVKKRLLLTSWNLSAVAASSLSHPEEARDYLTSARELAATIAPPDQCEPELAYQVSQTFKAHSRELWIAGTHQKAMDLLALAIQYCEKSVSAGNLSSIKYRELGHLSGRMARHLKDDNRIDEAISVYSQTIQYLSEGVALLGCQRSLTVLRATYRSELGQLLLKQDQPVQAVRVLIAADKDFIDLGLRKIDSKSSWFASIRTLQSLGLAHKQLGHSEQSFDAYIASLQQLNLMSSFSKHPKIAFHAKISKIALAQLNEAFEVSFDTKNALTH